jgi:hypothetical protein
MESPHIALKARHPSATQHITDHATRITDHASNMSTDHSLSVALATYPKFAKLQWRLGTAGALAIAAQYEGDPADLLAALVELRFIDGTGTDDDPYRIHDQLEYSPRVAPIMFVTSLTPSDTLKMQASGYANGDRQESPTLASLIRSRGRLLSLLDLVEWMKALEIDEIAGLISHLLHSSNNADDWAYSEEYARKYPEDDTSKNFTKWREEGLASIKTNILDPLGKLCEKLTLPATAVQLEIFHFEFPRLSNDDLSKRLMLLRNTLWVELRKGTFFYLGLDDVAKADAIWDARMEEMMVILPDSATFVYQALRCRMFDMLGLSAYCYICAIEFALRVLQANVSGLRLPPRGNETWGNWINEFNRFCVPISYKTRSGKNAKRLRHFHHEVQDVRDALFHIKHTRDHIGHPALRPLRIYEPHDLELIANSTKSILYTVTDVASKAKS